MLRSATSPPRIVTLILLTGLSVLSLNMFLPSLSNMAAEFQVDYSLISLSIAGYLAITAVLQVIMGPLSDRYGRRPVLLVGLVIFTLASLVCALTTSIWVFLAFRVLQGAVISGWALSLAVIRDMAPPKEAASLIGYVSMAMAVAPMLGPMLGGALDEVFGWRASFVVFTGFGAAALGLCWVDLGETNKTPSATFAEQFRTYPELFRSRRYWGYQPVDEVFPGRSRHGLILWCPGLKGGSLMAMGQQKDRQGDLMVSWSEMPRSPGHVFYDRLQLVLIEGGFDGFAEAVCQPYYAARMGAPSVPPGRYFRMHLVGYFEGIDSERGLEWRCSDSLSLREFLLLERRERVPDHSWLSRTRARLPHEVHTAVFDWVLALIAEAGLVKGERIGVDASTMEANAALRNIVRRDTGEGYRGMLERLAQESGIETPTAEDLARLDRKRKGKKLSNQDWVSRSDPEAKIAKMKDGTTHLAYKPEHAVDLDTGAVVAAELHPADEGDTTTLPKTLAAAEANLEAVDVAPTAEDPAECVTDKGYHSRLVLKALDDGPWKSRISEPKQKGFARWHGDDAARRAVTNNRTRLLSGVAREAFKLRAEIVERSFAHNLDRGGMRRTWLRGRENVHKRYLLHVAGHNLSLLMRQLIGAGTPKEAVAGGIGALFVLVTPAGAVLVVQSVLIVSEDGETAFAAICFAVA